MGRCFGIVKKYEGFHCQIRCKNIVRMKMFCTHHEYQDYNFPYKDILSEIMSFVYNTDRCIKCNKQIDLTIDVHSLCFDCRWKCLDCGKNYIERCICDLHEFKCPNCNKLLHSRGFFYNAPLLCGWCGIDIFYFNPFDKTEKTC